MKFKISSSTEARVKECMNYMGGVIIPRNMEVLFYLPFNKKSKNFFLTTNILTHLGLSNKCSFSLVNNV